MCGIAGFMTRNGAAPDAALLDRLTGALAHRGPDGRGRHVAGGVGLVQTRLAIIDLKTGDQPLHEPRGGTLVANGEIYNYVELRAELHGANLRTASDCEPPLHLWRSLGPGYADRLRGMYAIAIHDRDARTLTLSRDPFGIKPLYLAETEGGLAFASEPQALLAAGVVGRAENPAKRDELLQLQFTCGRETIFPGIARLLPGETAVARAGRIENTEHVPALIEGRPLPMDEAAALARLDAALEDSVNVHQRSDVPYAMFLSGGIDSSALLAMMARLNPRPVVAFTCGFAAEGAADERKKARAVAKALGAEHVEVELDEAGFWRLLPQVAAAMDDPAADYATVPTYLLASEAAKTFKVVLCGEGGDELFAGYGRYRAATRPPPLRKRMRGRGIFDGLGVLRETPARWRDAIATAEKAEARGGRSRLQVAQAVDCVDWLPNDLLVKLDRCLMAHGLEGRTPFLDPAIADFAIRLPDRLKLRDGLGKWLLRKWVDRHVPAARAFDRKQGFTVPVETWIARRGRELGELVAARDCVRAIAEPAKVRRLFRASGKREGFAAWVLLFYALWHRAHIEGRAPAGGVFDDLRA